MAVISIRNPSTSLSVALAHAVTFLTRSLILRYPAPTIIALQLALEATLLPYYEASWAPVDPSRGSGRRCLTLSPDILPPRPLYTAARAAKVDWSVWMETLGGGEFDLFVDPGRVHIRFAKSARSLIVWSAQPNTTPLDTTRNTTMTVPTIRIDRAGDAQIGDDAKAKAGATLRATMQQAARTRLLRSLVLQAAAAPSPVPSVPAAPANDARAFSPSHSRSSSQSSTSDYAASLFSDSGASAVSLDSATTVSSTSTSTSKTPAELFARAAAKHSISFITDPQPASAPRLASTLRAPKVAPSAAAAAALVTGPYKQSRRERARQRRAGIVIDSSRADAALYDGGRTTVLTGGVMLGGRRA